MRILGVDYGEKRIGLAVSDPLGLTAQGLQTLRWQNKKEMLEAMRRVCGEYAVSESVVGLPVNMNGSMGPKAKEILELIGEIERALNLPVRTWDERLTSREALRLMIAADLSRKKRRKASDRMAATLILQNYLEFKRK